MNDIDKIFMSSGKAELIERLTKELETFDKVIIVLIQDKENGKYSSLTMTLGLNRYYEAYGILEVAKQDLENDEDVIDHE